MGFQVFNCFRFVEVSQICGGRGFDTGAIHFWSMIKQMSSKVCVYVLSLPAIIYYTHVYTGLIKECMPF